MLDQAMKQQLQAYLEKLKTPVVISLNLDGSDKSAELDTLAKELVGLSTLIKLADSPLEGSRTPSMTLQGENGSRIEFAGVPMGHEFSSLVLALLQSGGHPPKLEAETRAQIKALDGDYQFEIFISLSCQNCPDVVQNINTMAAINPRIKAVMIDGGLFKSEVEQRNIMAVPSVYLNGEPFVQGRMSLTEVLNKLDSSLAGRGTQTLNEKAPFDLLVVGGGPAGASAAIYAARKGLRTGIVAENFGGQVLDTLAIENFISVKATEGPKLVAGLEEHVRDYEVDIMTGQRANGVSEKGPDGLISVSLESGAVLKAKSVIMATGARWRQINVPGEQEYKGKGVAYCPHCDGPLFKGKKVAVIGGGNSGMEAAIDLAGIVEHVTVLEYADTLKADQVLVDKAHSMGNIDIITQAKTLEVLGDGTKVNGLKYKDRDSGEIREIALAGVFVQIGLVPNTEFLKDVLELNQFGEILVRSKGETSLPGVFAAGDVTASPYKQIIIAMGSGANASLGAFDYLIRLDEKPEALAA